MSATTTPEAEIVTETDTTTAKMTMVQAICDAMSTEMDRDPSVIILGEDVGIDGGVFRATDGLIDRFGADRVLDTPLAEDGIVGTSIGLAVAGMRPVCEIQFMGFVYPALNQLFAHAARLRNRSRGTVTVPMVCRMPYGGGIHPPEHHSESYETIFLNTPGLKVVVPSNPYDAKGLLISAIRDEDTVIFMEPKKIYRAFRQDVPIGSYEVPLGKAAIARPGSDVTLVAYGAMVRLCLDAAQSLEAEGISAEIVDLRTLNPLDRETVLESVRKTGRCVVVHEAPRYCGVGAEISALLMEHCLLDLLAPVQRVTGFDVIFPMSKLEHHYMPTRERVVAAVNKTIDY